MKRFFIICCAVLIAALSFYFRKVSEKPEKDSSVMEEVSEKMKLSAVDFSQLEGFETDRVLEALPALRKSCSSNFH